MDEAEAELKQTKTDSRNILVLDILGCVILPLLMLFCRNKFGSIFKDMNVVPTMLHQKILLEYPPIVLIAAFIIIIAILILKEKVIKNKTITYFLNSIVLIVLVLLILFFLLGAFMPVVDVPITDLKEHSLIYSPSFIITYDEVIPMAIPGVALIVFAYFYVGSKIKAPIEKNQKPLFQEQCGARFNYIVNLTFPFVRHALYDRFIVISYGLSKLVINYYDLESATLKRYWFSKGIIYSHRRRDLPGSISIWSSSPEKVIKVLKDMNVLVK
ncbi:MAG: hypothetical protein WC317_07325 [Candidatus Omnitrophota bacterium]|jgi:hypothetical protein